MSGAGAKPKIDTRGLASPVAPPVELGVTSDPEPSEALEALKRAGQRAAITKTLQEAVDTKPKGSRAGMVTITTRLSQNQKTWFKIAAAKKGMTLEQYSKYCITKAFEIDGVTDDTGAAIVIA